MLVRLTLTAFCSLLLILTFSACNEESPFTPPVGTGYIWPLEIGNTWVWSIQEYDSSGAIFHSYVDSSVVTDTLTSMGSRWYRIQGYTDGYVRNGGDGLRFGDPGYSEFLYLKFPANVGDTIPNGTSYTILRSKSSPVTVKGQLKDSYHYETIHKGPISSSYTHQYLVPNIGRALLTGTDSTGTVVNYRLTLIDYRLK